MTQPTLNSGVYRLRRMTGEMLPMRFPDVEMEDILATYTKDGAEPDYELAALDVWYKKAAHWAGMIDSNESGSQRDLSQLHKAAVAQIKLLETRISKRASADADLQKTWRAVGRSVEVWGPLPASDPVLFGSNGSSNGVRA